MNYKIKLIFLILIFLIPYNVMFVNLTSVNESNLKTHSSIEDNKIGQESNRVSIFETLLFDIQDTNINNSTKMSKISSFVEEQKNFGFPITYNDTVYFIYLTNSSSTVRIFVGVFYNDTLMEHINGTDLFYMNFKLYKDTRTAYYFIDDNNTVFLDPLNPKLIENGCSGPECTNVTYASDLRMPDYSDDGAYSFEKEIGSQIINDSILSKVYSSPGINVYFNLSIYLPAGYSNTTPARYQTMYVADGPTYLNILRTKNVLDFLDYYNKTDPIIGIFIQPRNRNSEYRFFKEDYADFLAKDLVPYIDGKYHTINQSISRAHIGLSYGGYFSAFLGTRYPDVFDLIGSQSGSFWIGLFDYLYVPNNASWNKNFRLYFSGGTYDGGDILELSYQFAKFLYDSNYIGKFQGFHMAHEAADWQAGLGTMIEFLFIKSCSDYSGSPIMYPANSNLTRQICPVTETTTIVPSTSSSNTSQSNTTSKTNASNGFTIITFFMAIILVRILLRRKEKYYK